MANQYHDERGRFCSKDEMGGAIERLSILMSSPTMLPSEREEAREQWFTMKAEYEELLAQPEDHKTLSFLSNPSDVPLNKQAPVEVDGSLAELYQHLYHAQDDRSRAEALQKQYQRYIDDEGRRRDSALARAQANNGPQTQIDAINSSYEYTAKRYSDEVAKFQQQMDTADAKIEAVTAEIQPYEDEYERRGRWTRAFLVTNGNGHVHKNMNCSTCRPTTRFAWLTEYSDHKEGEIVEDAGERACTVCYPSAPVDVLKRATKIYSKEERKTMEEKAAKKAELDAKRAAKNAKKVTDENGNVIEYRAFGDRTGGYRQELNTEQTARSALVEIRENQIVRERKPGRLHDSPDKLAVWAEDYEIISGALARKLGVSIEELKADIEKRAEAKYKKAGWSSW
jgi:hypothetical protein